VRKGGGKGRKGERGGRRGREEREELLSSPHLTFIDGYPLFIYSKGGTEEREEERKRGDWEGLMSFILNTFHC
jgi:hypothetical protein